MILGTVLFDTVLYYPGGGTARVANPNTNDGVNAYGMNNGFNIVGSDGNVGFVLTIGPTPSFTDISFPGADSTSVTGVNDNGVIVGGYRSGGISHGFIGTPTAAPVPEPSTLAVIVAMLLMLGSRRVRGYIGNGLGQDISPQA